MKIGFIGLGKMGVNMVERLLRNGHEVITYDPFTSSEIAEVCKRSVRVSSEAKMVCKLPKHRNVWLMVPGGEPVK